MIRSIKLIGLLLLSLVINTSLQAQDNLNDPYSIMLKNIEAVGGLEQLKNEISSYVESDISIGGLQGIVKTWSMYPIYQRQELDLKVFKNTTGDNGEFQWSVDANGKVQILKDEELIKRRELSKLTADYEHLDRNSKIFKLEYRGINQIEESDCYTVLMNNSSNNDSTLTFINCVTFMTEKEVSYTSDEETQTLFSDYRNVNGTMKAFHQNVTTLPTNQEASVQITKYETNITIDKKLFEPEVEDKRDFRFVTGDRVENVSFEYIKNHIFIPINVGCKEKLWFLDTGAGMSVIDSTFASELGLTFEGEMVGQGVGNTVSFSFVKIPAMTLEGIEFDEQTVASINMKPLLQKAGMNAVGILGFDFISRFVIKVDYANKTLSFYDPETFEYKGDGVTLSAPLVGNNMTVPATVDGIYSGNWQLDLGAGGNSFHYPFAKSNDFLLLDGVETISFGAGGQMLSNSVKFKTFEIGGLVVDDPILDIPQESTSGTFSGSDLIGNIGNSFLKHFTLYIDYNKQELIVEKGDDFDKVFPLAKCGLQVMYDSNKNYEVINVASDTPADKSGLKSGDILLSINNVGIENFKGLSSINDIMSKSVGTTYNITISRRGVKKELHLTLEDIY